MLMRIRDGARIEVGCSFYRYFPKLAYVHNKGRVMTVSGGECEIDFGDTLVRYLLSEIAYVYNTALMDEHHMTLEEGTLVADYRSAPTILDIDANDPVLASFEELLSRI